MSEKQTYDYGCVMLYFDFPEIKNLHSLIDEDDIYTEEGDGSFGLEDDPHTMWDGRYNYKMCPDGVYTWKLQFSVFGNDSKISDNGQIILIR